MNPFYITLVGYLIAFVAFTAPFRNRHSESTNCVNVRAMYVNIRLWLPQQSVSRRGFLLVKIRNRYTQRVGQWPNVFSLR